MPAVELYHDGLVIEMAQRYCRNHDLHFLTDEDGDLLIPFSDMDLFIHLVSTGSKGNIYQILCRSTQEFDMARSDKAIALCNQWNEEKRWPVAYVSPDGDTFTFSLEQELDLVEGIHQELFESYTTTTIASCLQFWEWLPEQFPGAK